MVPDLVRRDWNRLERRVAAARAASDPEDKSARLHDVRRAAKRVRYGLEPLVPVYGRQGKAAGRGDGRPPNRARGSARRRGGPEAPARVVRPGDARQESTPSPWECYTPGNRPEPSDARDDFDRVWARAAAPSSAAGSPDSRADADSFTHVGQPRIAHRRMAGSSRGNSLLSVICVKISNAASICACQAEDGDWV